MRGDILIVDDESGPRESLRMILKKDHDVRTTSSGEEALEEIERRAPDLVLADLRMQGMSGVELLQAIKANHPDVEVAIITAYAAVDSARLAVRHGAVDYLTKPYAVADVERIVEQALSTRRQQHDAAILAAQLSKMTESLVGKMGSSTKVARPGVADAVDHIQSVQTAIKEDLDSLRSLSELGEAAAEVTHDINNLLSVILGNSQFILMLMDAQCETEPQVVSQRISRIVRAAQDCSAIIRRIKDFVRLNVNFRPAIIDVNDLVSSAVELKRDTLSATGKSVEYRLSLKPAVPICGDEVALRTVLVNMIENSLEALDSGFIELSTDFRQGHAYIQVRDNGCGMSPEVLESATQAFFSAKKAGGTGLGLSTADRVVQRHGGQLSIQSIEGVGTTVTMELPLATASASSKTEPDEAPEQAPAAAEEPATKRATVLVVDDEDGIRELMSEVLEAGGYSVLTARGGLDGWELFQETYARDEDAPLLVITDHEMPDLLGSELAARVKGAAPRVPVMIVSGYALSRAGGAEDLLLAKPFGIDEFLDRVHDLLTGQSALAYS